MQYVRLASHAETHGSDLSDVLLRACLAAGRAIHGSNADPKKEATKNNPVRTLAGSVGRCYPEERGDRTGVL